MKGTRIITLELEHTNDSPVDTAREARRILAMLTDEETTMLAEAGLILSIRATNHPERPVEMVPPTRYANIELLPTWAKNLMKGDKQ